MNTTTTTELVADATRRALDELDTLPPDAELKAVVILLEAWIPNDDDTTSTHVVWKVSPHISSTWLRGILTTAAHIVRQGWLTEDEP